MEGTTGLGYVVEEGIAVGVDSLARVGIVNDEGEYKLKPGCFGKIVSRTYDKIYGISHNIWCLMSGNLGIAESYVRIAHAEFRRKQSIENKPMSVDKIARFINNKMKRINGYSPLESKVNILVIGFDNDKIGRLYEVNGKYLKPRDYVAIGSGSEFVHDLLTDIKYYKKLEKGQVGELLNRCLCQAGVKDRATGGDKIRVYFITWKGIEELSEEKFESLRDLYCPGQKSAEELANQVDTDVEMVDAIQE